jgi:hypothetical protein
LARRCRHVLRSRPQATNRRPADRKMTIALSNSVMSDCFRCVVCRRFGTGGHRHKPDQIWLHVLEHVANGSSTATVLEWLLSRLFRSNPFDIASRHF